MLEKDLRRRKDNTIQIAGQFERRRESALFRLGSSKRPLNLRVQTEARKQELEALCREQDWYVNIDVAPDYEEDISDLDAVKNPPEPQRVEGNVGRNEPCPCGSGKKYKACHGRK